MSTGTQRSQRTRLTLNEIYNSETRENSVQIFFEDFNQNVMQLNISSIHMIVSLFAVNEEYTTDNSY
ncbi:hypothetical protein BpHYR1_035756 [Brachionus plicatilis]|uniref:Uncharacterized protein n=1 Tax=Brachionus plicatilis TaxID=10195 RepID=A0A3M7SSN5_BRAPC|nr:hypothetical protein BpHYR1_035756 [Brachionus plicatilis]